MTRLGVFDLVGVAPDEAELIEDAYSHIEFDWKLVEDALDGGVITVFTENLDGGLLGDYTRSMNLIRLNNSYSINHFPFTFTHETGHMIDDILLTDEKRNAIIAKMLLQTDGRHDAVEHQEVWDKAQTTYAWKINEAWADIFVAAWAPITWGLKSESGIPRFTHWVNDLDWIRALLPSAPTQPEKESQMFIAKCDGYAPVFFFSPGRMDHMTSRAELEKMAAYQGLPMTELSVSPTQWKIYCMGRTQYPAAVAGTAPK